MNFDQYKELYGNDDSDAPGRAAISQNLDRLYKNQKPLVQWATIISHRLGGPDPLDAVTIYENNTFQSPHFHFCSYGFSCLDYDEEAFGQEFSGCGFELTFRLSHKGENIHDLVWVVNLMQNLARYVFEYERGFGEHHWIPTNSPIKLDYNTDLVGLIFVKDPELPLIHTPHGKVELLQMVGITKSELEEIISKQRTVLEIATTLRKMNPLLITDLDRCN